MADLPTVNAIEELKQSNQDAIKTLDSSIVKGFSQLQNTSEGIAKSLMSILSINQQMFDQDKIDQLRLLEQLREDARKGNKPEKKVKKKDEDKGPLSELLDFLRNGGLLAGGALLAGLAGAALGLRGWEGKAIKNLSKIKMSVPKFITSGVTALKNAALAVFGIAPDGKFSRGIFTGVRVPDAISRTINSLKQSVFKLFGLGVDGKPVVKTPSWVKGGLKLTDMVGKQVTNLITSIKNGMTAVFTGIRTFFTSGAGSFVGKALAAIGRALRNVPIIGQIIGAIFAIFEGLFAAFTTEGTFAQKAAAFFAAAVSDFIGAPLDLLKDIFSWLAGKFGFDGLARRLDSFSFEDELEKFLLKPIEYIKGIFRWMGSLFKSDEQNELDDAQREANKTKYQLLVNRQKQAKARAQGDAEELARLKEEEGQLVQRRSEDGKRISEAQKALDAEKNKPSFLERIRSFDVTDFLKNLVGGVLQSLQGEDGIFYAGLRKLMQSVGAYEFAGINAETGEKIETPDVESVEPPEPTRPVTEAVQPVDEFTGAEVDTRSREVASQPQQNVQISAPQQQTVNNNSQKTNNTTVAPTSARRGRMPLPAGYQDPILGP